MFDGSYILSNFYKHSIISFKNFILFVERKLQVFEKKILVKCFDMEGIKHMMLHHKDSLDLYG
jgi:hypothetical protein